MLKIRQSYHGTGGREGYRFKVYKNNRKIGELKDFPVPSGTGDIVKIGEDLFIISASYSSENPRHEKTEVQFYELEPYIHKPKFVDLGELIK